MSPSGPRPWTLSVTRSEGSSSVRSVPSGVILINQHRIHPHFKELVSTFNFHQFDELKPVKSQEDKLDPRRSIVEVRINLVQNIILNLIIMIMFRSKASM